MSNLPNGLVGDETHALRNPQQLTQDIRTSNAQTSSSRTPGSVSAYYQAKERAAKKKAIEAEVQEIHDNCKMRIQEISAKYSVQEQVIRDNVYHISSFKPERPIQWWNARVSAKKVELRKQNPTGKRTRLKGLHQQVLEKNEEDYTPEEREEIWRVAREERERKKRGARLTNRGAAQDVYKTSDRIVSEINKACARTGVQGVFALTKGHQNDIHNPTVYETPGATGFCQQVLGVGPVDIAGRLECWATSGGTAFQTRQDRATLRKECTAMILKGLYEISGGKVQKMNYDNYAVAIVLRYRIHLMGWPDNLPMANPSSFETVDQVRRLRDALLSGKCHWKRMNAEECQEYEDNLEEIRRNGGTVGVPRKERCDKNKKRKQRVGDGQENEPVTRQPKRVAIHNQLPPNILNNVLVFSDHHDGEDFNGETYNGETTNAAPATPHIIQHSVHMDASVPEPVSTSFVDTPATSLPNITADDSFLPPQYDPYNTFQSLPATAGGYNFLNTCSATTTAFTSAPTNTVDSITTDKPSLMGEPSSGEGVGNMTSSTSVSLTANWFDSFDFSFAMDNTLPSEPLEVPQELSEVYLPPPPSSPCQPEQASPIPSPDSLPITAPTTTTTTITAPTTTTTTITTSTAAPDVSGRHSSRLNGCHVRVTFE